METLLLNGKSLNLQHVIKGEYDLEHHSSFEKKTLEFIKNYLSEQSEFTFFTSGSTGIPKAITFRKKQLQKSALRTNHFFGLSIGSTILCCLNPDFVAGKMMLVRALVGNLNLIIEKPKSNPLVDIPSKQIVDFMAITPLQMDSILTETPEKLASVRTILIGGADVHPSLEDKLQKHNTRVFHSYAMTETLTHVALRQLNGPKKTSTFHALPGISFTVDNRGCLVISDSILEIDQLITNDLVKLIDVKSFHWNGRFDNVINSGGIKIQLEETENKIIQILKADRIDLPLCLLSLPDDRLGNKLALLVETTGNKVNERNIKKILKEKLPKFHDPKVVLLVPKLITTPSGKIDRIKNTAKYFTENIRN